jgi:hypothetical protein
MRRPSKSLTHLRVYHMDCPVGTGLDNVGDVDAGRTVDASMQTGITAAGGRARMSKESYEFQVPEATWTSN